jgi:hypothetical protein
VNVLPQHRHSFPLEAEGDDFEADDDFEPELFEHPTISKDTISNIVFIVNSFILLTLTRI